MARILVATANADLRAYIGEGLGAAEHELHFAASIDEVMDAAADHRFDVAVMDVFTPVLEGVALAATLARACPHTRILALLDYTTARARNYELHVWAESVLTKPLSGERIANEVAFLLEKPARRAVPA